MILQRASAGSGKTFKLAKTYIRLFLAHREEESGRYTLLPAGALRESHSRILGVTFTNKATNEMKERIVSKLAALADTHPARGCEPSGWKAPDYLLDFTGESDKATEEDDVIFNADGLPATRADITRAARNALRVLLNDYGHFNISTIDTFFQSVLRTFAYELRLNDNYHVELNDEYLAQVGIDRTLSMVNNPEDASTEHTEAQISRYVSSWARETIADRLGRGESWNMFNKSSNSGVYADLLDLTKKMNKESFKLRARQLDDYFADISRYDRFYAGCRKASGEVTDLYNAAVSTFKSLLKAIADTGGGDPAEFLSGVKGCFALIRDAKPFTQLSAQKLGTKLSIYFCAEPPEFDPAKHFILKKFKWCDEPQITSLFRQLGHDLFVWQRTRSYWTSILSRLHYLGLLHYIRLNSEEFRNDNNLIPLSATNDILHRIINRDDTPFIYERIGTRLDHYLLDEFQDTSTMQWTNLRPLLEQSTDAGEECLIIGDAKQSIYRFRNAEPDIINNQVAAAIPSTRVLPSPASPAVERAEVNANYRSSREVVLANNTIFTLLPQLIGANPEYLAKLYDGAVQEVKREDLAGYVDISFDRPLGAQFLENSNEEESSRVDPYEHIGLLIDDLRSRGFSMSGIAILVNRNKEGSAVIDSIMAHNALQKGIDSSYKPIEILSEESLMVSDSAAVKVILAVLAAIARGFRQEDRQTDTPESDKPLQIKQYELAQFVANFHCYFAAHRDEPLDSILKKDLDELLPADAIQKMLQGSPATTLPALVEDIAATFTSTLGGEQAPYIAAFQDAVLEYCESYPADIASFLSWWEENGKKCSIAAPEGIDAVRIMTIHKSKGLEFDAVLIPKADWNIMPSASDAARELIWVEHLPELPEVDSSDIPAFIPITPTLEMADPDSPFHREYKAYELEHSVDQLNKTYVAFTRAVRELHVYAPVHKKLDARTVRYVGDYLADVAELINSLPDTPLLLNSTDCTATPGSLQAGHPQLLPAAEQPQADSTDDIIIIDTYSPTQVPNLGPARLHTLSE